LAITVPYTFTSGTTILSAEVNSNFTEITVKAVDKTGDTVTGAITFSVAPVFSAALGTVTITSLTANGLTLAGPVSAADNLLTRPEIKDYAETVQAATIGGTTTFNFEDGNVGTLTLSQNTTLAFSNPPASGKCGSLTLILTQDGTGSRTVTWPAAVKWAGGVAAPTMTTTASRSDVYVITTTNGGTSYIGTVVGQNFTL
jgi:hypothetical protein